jgi:DNA primase
MRPDRFDPDEIRRSVPIELEIGRHLKLKHDGREFSALCPFHNERTPSFKVIPDTVDKLNGGGFFHCFGCGAHGDVIAFTMRIHGVAFPNACEMLSGGSTPPRSIATVGETRDLYADLIAATPPARSPRAGEWLELWNPKGVLKSPPRPLWKCRPSAVYTYRDSARAVLGHVLRIDMEDGKITPTIRYAKCPDGVSRWASWRFDKPRPIYRAEHLSREQGPVIVTEGEKASDAAITLLGTLAVTWPNGGKSVQYADWFLLTGRDLYLWGDADQEGEYAMIGKPSIDGRPATPGVAQLAAAAGAKIKAAFEWDRSKPKGWDAADALRDGWSRQQAIEWMNKQVRIWN